MSPVANEQFANALLIEVGGTPLPADVLSLLVYAYVDDSRNLPDRFLLRFRDPGRTVLAKGGFTIGAKVTLRVQTSDPGGPQPLMAGEITGLACEVDPSGTFSEVRGLDPAHRLFRGRRVAAYPNMTLPDVVRRVARRAGLKAGQVDAVAGFGGDPERQLSQDNVSDWEFLSRLADLVGAQVQVLDGALHFRLPTPPDGAPPPTARATQDPLVLEVGRNVVSLRAEITATAQVPEVSVRGWDTATKQAISAAATPKAAGTEVAGVRPDELGRAFGSPSYLVADPRLTSDGAIRTVAGALADRLGSGFVEVEGVAKGNARLRAGAAVALANVGEPFQGRYVLTSTRHLFSEQAGYTTSFTVSGRSDRSLYSLTGGGDGGSERVATGLVPAIVSDIKDPRRLGRVRLTLPWLDKQYTTGWARVVAPGAGANRGLLLPPEVGDEVLVGFTGADLDSAYVIGGLYNGNDTPPQLGTDAVDASSGEVVARGLVSRTGHRLELAEAANGPNGIVLSSGDGKFVLRLDQQSQLVEISSAGPVKITGRNGVTVDAGTGALELSGQSVSVKSSGSASVEGATVKVTGQSSTEVTASGQLTVRGGIVKIN